MLYIRVDVQTGEPTFFIAEEMRPRLVTIRWVKRKVVRTKKRRRTVELDVGETRIRSKNVIRRVAWEVGDDQCSILIRDLFLEGEDEDQ